MVKKLSKPITITGQVIHGDKQGRKLGFPTANLNTPITEADLQPGVYFGQCTFEKEKKTYNCLPYFGPRLVFDETIHQFEVYIYDFDQEVYGQELHCQLTHYIRPPQDFKGMPKLRNALEKDKQTGLNLIKDL